MPPAAEVDGGQDPPRLAIPEIRDYQKINAELVALLDRGHRHVRLEGAEGQRLLASGLSGGWDAVVEIVGRTGPELAANLDAPGLTVVARGPTADGAGRGLKRGRVIVLGDSGDGAGYAQSGGLLVIAGSAGHRAGLRQSGGSLVVVGTCGRLAADRQSGGRFFVDRRTLGPHDGRGRVGGRLIDLAESATLEGEDASAWREVSELTKPWLGPDVASSI